MADITSPKWSKLILLLLGQNNITYLLMWSIEKDKHHFCEINFKGVKTDSINKIPRNSLVV